MYYIIMNFYSHEQFWNLFNQPNNLFQDFLHLSLLQFLLLRAVHLSLFWFSTYCSSLLYTFTHVYKYDIQASFITIYMSTFFILLLVIYAIIQTQVR